MDRDTINTIEELHSAVMRADAERRFGPIRGKRTTAPTDAQAAEQAFLAQHGFATYNDFRLRIRRSTASPADTVDPAAGTDDGMAAEGAGARPADLSPPATVTPPQRDRAETPNEFRRRIEALCGAFQNDAEELIAVRLDDVERQAGLIVDQASSEAAEIIGRATRAHDAVTAVVEDVTHQAEHLLAVIGDLPGRVDDVRTKTGAVLRALGQLSGRESPSDSPR